MIDAAKIARVRRSRYSLEECIGDLATIELPQEYFRMVNNPAQISRLHTREQGRPLVETPATETWARISTLA
jgi:hypothetical protein